MKPVYEVDKYYDHSGMKTFVNIFGNQLKMSIKSTCIKVITILKVAWWHYFVYTCTIRSTQQNISMSLHIAYYI